MDVLFEGQTAIVSGGAKGIGHAIASALGGRGAHVFVLDIEQPTASYDTERVEFIHCDVSERGDWENALEYVVNRAERVPTIVVNNAGIFPKKDSRDVTPEEWDRVLKVNLYGAFYGCQTFGSHMIAHNVRGSIINIASGRALQGAAKGVAYAASKSGILGLTKSLAAEWGPYGIRVNTIIPGISDTDQPRAHMSEEELYASARKIPLGRIGVPEDIAKAVLFLASDYAEFVNGHSLVVNGGAIMI